MTLDEYEIKLSELDDKISLLLQERESLLKGWNMKFSEEDSEKVSCVDDYSGNCHKLFLINEQEAMLYVCDIWDDDLRKDIGEYYKLVDNSMQIHSIARGMQGEVPKLQKNLIYAKAAEIRGKYKQNSDTKITDIRDYQRHY